MNKNYNYSILKEDDTLFFSLMDYRNNYFISKKLNKILDFYTGFGTRDELIEWIMERPHGNYRIEEIEGSKDIIVVIPTVDIESTFAKYCREKIFNGLHIVFVESGYNNFYFNYAHNCNAGIKKALEYNPKWIIVSNDDMNIIDPPEKLKEVIQSDSNKDKDVLFCSPPAEYHSRYALISKQTLRRRIVNHLMGKYEKELFSLERRLGIKYIVGTTLLKYRLFYSNKYKLLYTGSFGIFSSQFIVNHLNHQLFDENYINGSEDIDLAWSIAQKKINFGFINYRIKDIKGGTIGPYDIKRKLQGIINECYMNYKIEKSELTISSLKF
jgi:hypothetical protein